VRGVETWNWQRRLAIGYWLLVTGDWRMATGDLQMAMTEGTNNVRDVGV
jgi:hypothetical protein